MLVWFICLEISENKEREKRVWEFSSGLQGQARKEEKPVGGEQHLSTTSIYFKFDPFRLPLILVWLRAQKGGSFSNSELGTSAFP